MIYSITESLKGYLSESLSSLKQDLREKLRKDLRPEIDHHRLSLGGRDSYYGPQG